MRTAFKEWGAVCHALAEGRQTVILRKGGVAEQGGRFRLDHAAFLLLPTFAHQSAAQLAPEAAPLIEQSRAEAPAADEIVISHWVQVAAAAEIRDERDLVLFRGSHVWADAVVAERFRRWRSPGLVAMVARVFALPTPARLPTRTEYAGCASWVNLDDEVSVEGSSPVLSDGDFDERTATIREFLRFGAATLEEPSR